VRTAVRLHSGAGTVLLVLGLATALYGASGAFGAAGRALNVIAGHDEDRSFVERKAGGLAWTLLLIVLGVLVLVLVFLGGGVAHDLFAAIGLGSTAAGIWTVARWPAAILVMIVIYAIVYWAAPDARNRFRPFTPGAAAGVVLWGAASGGFFLFVSSFGSYNATYGAFAGVVILLVWLYLTNVALLLGAEINAVLDEPPADAPAA
jgi:membrane protein